MNNETKDTLLAIAECLERRARFECPTRYSNDDYETAETNAVRRVYQAVAEDLRWLVNPESFKPRCVTCGCFGEGWHAFTCPDYGKK